MSKSKSKTPPATCLSCGKGLTKKDRYCRRCGRANLAFAKKSAGNVVPITAGRRSHRCWNGCPPGKRGAKFCVACGEAYAMTYSEHVAKAFPSALSSADPVVRAIANEADPSLRDFLWKAAHPVITKGGGAAC